MYAVSSGKGDLATFHAVKSLSLGLHFVDHFTICLLWNLLTVLLYIPLRTPFLFYVETRRPNERERSRSWTASLMKIRRQIRAYVGRRLYRSGPDMTSGRIEGSRNISPWIQKRKKPAPPSSRQMTAFLIRRGSTMAKDTPSLVLCSRCRQLFATKRVRLSLPELHRKNLLTTCFKPPHPQLRLGGVHIHKINDTDDRLRMLAGGWCSGW